MFACVYFLFISLRNLGSQRQTYLTNVETLATFLEATSWVWKLYIVV